MGSAQEKDPRTRKLLVSIDSNIVSLDTTINEVGVLACV